MRNKGKFELYLSSLSREDQDFVAAYGAKALDNKAMFWFARGIYEDIKSNSKAEPSRKLLALFVDAINKKDFRAVNVFVELLEEWTHSLLENPKSKNYFERWKHVPTDPVTSALLERATKHVRRSDKPFDFKRVPLKQIDRTARWILALAKHRAPGFECDIKTIRNRAKELGLKLAPDKRGIRKGQKRNHIHRVQR